MIEKIYNIFIEVNDGLIRRLGAIEHVMDGTDDEKLEFLKAHVDHDIANVKYFPVPDRYVIVSNGVHNKGILSYEKYIQLDQLGRLYELISEILEFYDTVEEPLVCITPITDGQIVIDNIAKLYSNPEEIREIQFKSAPKYLEKYIRGDIFYITELINDDFFEPIKLLNNNGFYSAATKLLLSAVDTFAFLEYGDKPGNFIKWVKTYIDLEQVKVSSEEIWELRNSLLHMTNYESRKVKQGVVKSLIITAGKDYFYKLEDDSYFKPLNFHKFYAETSKGIEKWLTNVMKNTDQIQLFMDRYDLIISDYRKDEIIISK